MMRTRLLALLVCSAALPLMAQSSDVGAWYERVTVHRTNVPEGTIRFDRGNGWAISANHFWMAGFSTELAYASTESDGRVDFTDGTSLDAGRLKLKATTLVGQWHFTRRSRIDPYIGGGVARISAGSLSSADLESSGVTSVHIDSKSTWCANAGVNFALTKQIAIAVDGKYVRYTPNSAAPGDTESVPLRLSPTFIAAGVRLRF